MSNRQATKKAEFQHQGASARSPRLSSKARRPEARVSAARRVSPKPASQHQGTSARSPRLRIRARRPEARVSTSRRVEARVSVATTRNKGASHRTCSGKWPLIVERFQGARSSPGTSINSPVGINKNTHTHRERTTTIIGQRDRRTIVGQEDHQQRERRLFSELTEYQPLFAYLLF